MMDNFLTKHLREAGILNPKVDWNAAVLELVKGSPNQPRDEEGRWTEGGGGGGSKLPAQWSTEFHDKDGNVKMDKISSAIDKAVAENPGRATHGYTAKNAFFVVNGKTYAYNDFHKIPPKERGQAMVVHSHGPENWREYQEETGKLSGFSPHNAEDVRINLDQFRKGQAGSVAAIIMPDGRMEVLAIKPTTKGTVFGLSKKKLEALIDPKYGEAGDWLKKNPGKSTDDFAREKLKNFAKTYNLEYREGRWSGLK